MKLVFWGYNPMGEHALRFFLENGIEVPVVITPSDEAEKLASLRALLGKQTEIIPITAQPYHALRKHLEQVAPDLMISCSFRYKIPAELLAINGVRIFNVHGARLPHFRGGNMLNWTVINGASEMVLTLHIVEEMLDTGDVLAEVAFPIAWHDDVNAVKSGMYSALHRLFSENLDHLRNKSFTPRPQDHTLARYFPARTPEDGRINWNTNAVDIYNLVRGLVAPYPGAFTYYKGRVLIVERAEVVFNNRVYMSPGKVIRVTDEGILVSTLFNLLKITEIRGVDLAKSGIEPGTFFSSKQEA